MRTWPSRNSPKGRGERGVFEPDGKWGTSSSGKRVCAEDVKIVVQVCGKAFMLELEVVRQLGGEKPLE